jgi:predicted nucleic acid-binding protein
LYEVCRPINRNVSEDTALLAVARMLETSLVRLTAGLALEAAGTGLVHGLATADAIAYATAQAYSATLVTGDRHFLGLPNVRCTGPGARPAADRDASSPPHFQFLRCSPSP